MISPNEINLRHVLVGYPAADKLVDFDKKYIVLASGDCTIKVWTNSQLDVFHTLMVRSPNANTIYFLSKSTM